MKTTPVPVLAEGKTDTARDWVYVRDEAPLGGADPSATLFRYSRNRAGTHPVERLRGFAGIRQADPYAGFNRLYAPGRVPGPVTECLCGAHRRRKFYELADIAAGKRGGKDAAPVSPLALEAVRRIDALFDIEREMNGESAERRLAVRCERAWLSCHAPMAKVMDYMLRRWEGFTRFFDDGRRAPLRPGGLGARLRAVTWRSTQTLRPSAQGITVERWRDRGRVRLDRAMGYRGTVSTRSRAGMRLPRRGVAPVKRPRPPGTLSSHARLGDLAERARCTKQRKSPLSRSTRDVGVAPRRVRVP